MNSTLPLPWMGKLSCRLSTLTFLFELLSCYSLYDFFLFFGGGGCACVCGPNKIFENFASLGGPMRSS